MIPHKCDPSFALIFPNNDFYLGGRLPVTSQKKKKWIIVLQCWVALEQEKYQL